MRLKKQYSSTSDEDETTHLQRPYIHLYYDGQKNKSAKICRYYRQTIWCDMDDILSSAYERLKSAERNHIIHIDKILVSTEHPYFLH